MARRPVHHLRRIIIPVGRGRAFKTGLADALYEEMVERGLAVTAWDVDRAPSLKRRVADARRPAGPSERARQACLEDCIHTTFSGEGHAIVDVGADDLTLHQIADKLPEMRELLAEASIEVVGIHTLGPDPDKDLAYYRATKDSNVFSRQIVVLNHGLAPPSVDADDAFAAVRRIANSNIPRMPVYFIRALPPEVISAMWPEDLRKMVSLIHLAGLESPLHWTNRMVLRSFLNKEIGPLIDEILAGPAEQREEATSHG